MTAIAPAIDSGSTMSAICASGPTDGWREPRIVSNNAANQEIGGNTCPVAVGTIMKHSTAVRKTNCSSEPAVSAACALTSSTSSPRTTTSVQNMKIAPPIVPDRWPARCCGMRPSMAPVTNPNETPDMTLTARAVPTRNVASAANFAPTIVRPRRGNGPSTIASRLSKTSVSQMKAVSRPVEIIEYDTNSTAICASEPSMSCGMFLALATFTISS